MDARYKAQESSRPSGDEVEIRAARDCGIACSRQPHYEQHPAQASLEAAERINAGPDEGRELSRRGFNTQERRGNMPAA